MTDSQKDLCVKAGQTISNLDFLTKREEFQEFIANHRRNAEAIAERILDDDSLSPEERERLRQRRKGMLEVLDSPAEDMRVNRGIIDSYYGPGGDPDGD
jgi:hypothetical protein